MAVILSAQCTDQRVNQVTETLFQKYHKPKDFLKTPPEVLEQEIRSTGFYRQKAKSLRNCCRQLIGLFNGELPHQIDDLVKLPGVGRKTAAMVLGNSFGLQQGIAVDTHLKRVAQRTGLSEQKNVDKMEKELMNLVPQKKWTWFSNAAILFGRNICQARKPKCSECPFVKWCPSK